MIAGENNMGILAWILVGIICFIVIKSMVEFVIGNQFHKKEMREHAFSLEVFYTLLITYSIVITGFGLVYFILSFEGIILVENGEFRRTNVIGSLIHSFYFSGVTMLTIGYGDITPIGIGRLLALIEALIGYVLPTAFVLRIVHTQGSEREGGRS